MNRFILFLVTVFSVNISFAQSDFIVRQSDNDYFIQHKVKTGESFYQLARDYSLKSVVLEKYNEVLVKNGLQVGQIINIPLTETNFFKMAGLSEAKGFARVYYQTNGTELKTNIEKKFLVPTTTFDQWNPTAKSTLRNGEKIMVGWLKYNNVNYDNADLAIENNETGNVVNNESSATSSSEVKTIKNNTDKTEILNPRYIDPNAPPRPKVVNNNYRRYTPNTPVKKEVQSIGDDSKDLLSKTKRIFKSNKKNNTKVTESKTENNVDNKPIASSTTKETKKTQPKKASKKESEKEELDIPNKYKNYDVADKENTKSKNVWKDFKHSFTVKDKEPKHSSTEVATPKAVKEDPNRLYKDGKPESKSKTVWNDFKNSFKKDKKETADDKYAVKRQAQAEKKATKPVAIKNNKVKNAKPANTKPTVAIQKETIQEEVMVDKIPKTKVVKKVKTANVKKESTAKSALKKTNVKTSDKEKKDLMLEAKVDAKDVITDAEINEEIAKAKEPMVKNDIVHLSLKKSESGRASYFFSGPTSGKFYVATNLASKGQIIKVVNPENGKYIMAEVLSSLPSTDAAKGILLKISDNAKMPLGQKNSSFNVKVNY